MSIDAGTQVAIILLAFGPCEVIVNFGTGYVLRVELPVQRRFCPIFVRDVGSPDIHECFRGLTGNQRTPGIWGVTDWILVIYLKIIIIFINFVLFIYFYMRKS